MQELIKAVKKRMSELSNLGEENIKNHVVVNVFLKELGYNPENWDYEEAIYEGRADIVYKIKNEPLFIVETKGQKKGSQTTNIDLTEKDMKQLSEYLNSHKPVIDWGLLTNGIRYILLNNSIEGEIPDRIVFDISFDDSHNRDRAYLKYYSYENLFVNKTTQYFADIAQFKSFAKKDGTLDMKNWSVYKSTLFRFFDYYAKQNGYKIISKAPHEILSRIHPEDFIEFVNEKSKNRGFGKRVTSKETVKSNFSYLSSFFKTLSAHSYVNNQNFTQGRDFSLSEVVDTPKKKSDNYVDENTFKEALSYYYSSKTNYRDIAVFLLCAYYGLERSVVHNLKWDSIDLNKRIFRVNEQKCEIIDLLELCFVEIKKQNKGNKNKSKYVFTSRTGSKNEKANASTLNDVFNRLKNIRNNEGFWSFFSPQYVRNCLVYRMFEAGFSLEQIIYFTGIDIKKISNYISSDKIIEEGKKRYRSGMKSNVVHPFKKVVDEFYAYITTK
ncbi:tyrosine-type recombinase/integrase [Ruminococcus sp.]|uniref:tyrosine-type recombinase/integrase n=1 Tax=Ruminococcus sp. TaxID=41978 RepID=UPI0025FC8701|nr:tyrosine-type recombinase/integrase [Ruminococcus sp.]